MDDRQRALTKWEADLLAARIHRLEEYVDTVSSPLWKRLWFVVQGYRFRQLGVWYRASWNRSGWEYEEP